MAQIINTNIPSLNAQRNLNTSQGSLTQALQRLSSGLRINSARDDAAGMAIAENMTAQSRGMTVAMRNANDGISAGQTAEAGLTAIGGHLQRMRELAVQAASGQYDSINRAALDAEFQQLAVEISRAVDATNFNGKQLLRATPSAASESVLDTKPDTTKGDGWAAEFQVGATTEVNSRIGIILKDFNKAIMSNKLNSDMDIAGLYSQGALAKNAGTAELALTDGSLTNVTGTHISDVKSALQAMDKVDALLTLTNRARADLGAIQSRFEGVLTQLSAAQENTEAARSRITDADYASETAKLARSQILQQAGTAMLAQANALPQNVLSLLQ